MPVEGQLEILPRVVAERAVLTQRKPILALRLQRFIQLRLAVRKQATRQIMPHKTRVILRGSVVTIPLALWLKAAQVAHWLHLIALMEQAA